MLFGKYIVSHSYQIQVSSSIIWVTTYVIMIIKILLSGCAHNFWARFEIFKSEAVWPLTLLEVALMFGS